MANTLQSKKRIRQAQAHRERNVGQRSALRTYVKNVINAILLKDKEKAADAFVRAVPVLDRMATKGLIHKNKAARYKSRLNARIKSMA